MTAASAPSYYGHVCLVRADDCNLRRHDDVRLGGIAISWREVDGELRVVGDTVVVGGRCSGGPIGHTRVGEQHVKPGRVSPGGTERTRVSVAVGDVRSEARTIAGSRESQ